MTDIVIIKRKGNGNNKIIKQDKTTVKIIKQIQNPIPKPVFELPECSVLLPVFNNKDDILEAIYSVINQTFIKWELIVIDDCSTDGTYDVVNEFINNNPEYNIRLYKNHVNQGTYISLNEGLKRAKGKYIARIDSDDTMVKNMLEEHLRVLYNNRHYIASQSQYIREGCEKKFGEITLVYNKKVIDEIGYYDSVRFGADTEFMMRLKRRYGNPKIIKIDKVLYHAKQREQSLTTSNQTGIEGEGAIIRKQYRSNYIEWHRKNKLYIPYPLTNRPFEVPEKMLPDRKKQIDNA